MKIVIARPQELSTARRNLKKLNLCSLESYLPQDPSLQGLIIPLMFSSEGVLIKKTFDFLSDRAFYGSGRNQSNTVRTYAECLYSWLQYLESIDCDWRHATRRHLLSYRNSQKDNLSLQTKRQIKSATINLRMTVVIEFYKFLLSKNSNAIESNEKDSLVATIMESKRTYKLRKTLSRPRALNQDMCSKLMNALKGVHRIIFAWSLATGVRTSSILNITLAEYQELNTDYSDGFIDLLMKGGRMQKVYVPHALRSETERYLNTTRVLNSKPKLWQSDKQLSLFLNSKGEAVTRSCYYAAFQRACKSQKLKANPHQARTTFATFMERRISTAGLNLGFDHVKIIQGLLGHASAVTTQQYLEDIAGNNIDVLALIESHAEFLRVI